MKILQGLVDKGKRAYYTGLDGGIGVTNLNNDAIELLRLTWKQRGQHVLVEPDDEDRFCIAVDRVIRACQTEIKREDFERKFRLLLRKLAIWISSHSNLLSKACLTIRDQGLLFLVVRKDLRLDENLSDSLTALDIEIAQDPQLQEIRLSVLALPATSDEGIASFLVPGETLTYKHAR